MKTSVSYEAYIRATIKNIGRTKSRKLFTILSLIKPNDSEEVEVKELGLMGLRYLNTGSVKPKGAVE